MRGEAPELLPSTFPLQAFISYARYTREDVESACDSPDQDDCFGTGDAASYRNDDLSQTWRSWIWQVCTEWGFFQGGAPAGKPTIVSRLITVEYNDRICDFAFGKGSPLIPLQGPEADDVTAAPSTPNVTMVNQYGGFDVSSPRLAFIDGSADPWIGATPHSPWAPDGGEHKSTTSRPFWLIPDGVHHYDEGGAAHEPDQIVAVHAEEKRFVKEWVDAFVAERG